MSKKRLWSLDWGILTPVVILVGISLTTLFSINIDLFKSQLFFLSFSFVALIVFSQASYKAIQLYAFPIYIASLFVLLLVLIVGVESHGAVRWFDFFGFRIQFSEIIKPFLIISLSAFLSKRKIDFKTFYLTFLFLLPIIFLIYKQPDLGNAIIFAIVTVFTLIFAGFPLLWFGAGFLVVILAFPIAWPFLHDYQRQRLLTFFNPTHDPLGTSYNIIQSVIAVGAGMFFGKGMSQGTQSALRFLPERHTDFIFATISEDLGFVGSALVILCFGFLLYRIFMIFLESEDKFSKIFLASSFFLILTQFFLNAGMNIGIVPIVGITLPFVSYGGSSLLSSFILLGLISSASNTLKDKSALEIG